MASQAKSAPPVGGYQLGLGHRSYDDPFAPEYQLCELGDQQKQKKYEVQQNKKTQLETANRGNSLVLFEFVGFTGPRLVTGAKLGIASNC